MSSLRKEALGIIRGGIRSVMPEIFIREEVFFDKEKGLLSIKTPKKEGTFKVDGKIFVVGIGKAAPEMFLSLMKVLKTNLSFGMVVSNHEKKPGKVRVLLAGHPFPNRGSILAAKKVLSLKERFEMGEKDTIIFLISGGASALFEFPEGGVSLRDLRKLNKLLVTSGASIEEINIVRKAISRVKGGKLASFFYPVRVISLILSDVINNDLSTIGSGLTYKEKHSTEDAYLILKKYGLLRELPSSIIKVLKKKDESSLRLSRTHNFVLADLNRALRAMYEGAKNRGWKTRMLPRKIRGEPCEVARELFRYMKKHREIECLIFGGETHPKLPHTFGKGGRNQQLILCFLRLLLKEKPAYKFALASVNTDGRDFIKGVAGGIIENSSLKKIKLSVLERAIRNFNSYPLLKEIGGIVRMKDTGTNVGDIGVFMIKRG